MSHCESFARPTTRIHRWRFFSGWQIGACARMPESRLLPVETSPCGRSPLPLPCRVVVCRAARAVQTCSSLVAAAWVCRKTASLNAARCSRRKVLDLTGALSPLSLSLSLSLCRECACVCLCARAVLCVATAVAAATCTTSPGLPHSLWTTLEGNTSFCRRTNLRILTRSKPVFD